MICANCHGQAVGDVCGECGDATLLDNRYRLEDLLGSGASGMTFRATNLESGESVAIKELDWRKLDALKTEQLFNREAEVLRQLDHPGIPRYIETFTRESGRHVAAYLVQEFIDGKTLEEEQSDRRYDLADVLDIADELLEIVAYLHARTPPVIHRDIKPKNVMRRNAGDLVLIDFGSVRSVANVEGGSTIAGTVGYMAPEQLVGKALPASDLFGVGAMIAALVSGIDPSNYLGVGKPDLWRNFVKVPRPVEELLAMLLEPDPGERADDARFVQQWVRDLREKAQSGFPAARAERPPNTASPTSAASQNHAAAVQKRGGLVIAGIAAALVVASGAVSFLIVEKSSTSDPVPSPPEIVEGTDLIGLTEITGLNGLEDFEMEQQIPTLEVGQLGDAARIGGTLSETGDRAEYDTSTGYHTMPMEIAGLTWQCELDFRGEEDVLRRWTCESPPLGATRVPTTQSVATLLERMYGTPNRSLFNKSVWETQDVLMVVERLPGEPPRMRLTSMRPTEFPQLELLEDPPVE